MDSDFKFLLAMLGMPLFFGIASLFVASQSYLDKQYVRTLAEESKTGELLSLATVKNDDLYISKRGEKSAAFFCSSTDGVIDDSASLSAYKNVRRVCDEARTQITAILNSDTVPTKPIMKTSVNLSSKDFFFLVDGDSQPICKVRRDGMQIVPVNGQKIKDFRQNIGFCLWFKQELMSDPA